MGAALDVWQRPDGDHVVLADPGGNEFCVIALGNHFLAGCGFVGEVSCDGTREVGCEPLPTLREMIERRRNALVLVENEGGAEPWYVPAFEALEETPYRFDSRGDFSCEPNRGVEGNPLLLVNHWITLTAPDPLVAADVNRSDVLLDRAEECEEERERRPNIIAVDFYTHGDLLDVVAQLDASD